MDLAHIAEFIRDGGTFMYINLVVSVATVAVIVERVLRLFFQYNIKGREFIEQINKLVAEENYERAIKLCNSMPSAMLPRVIKDGLMVAHKGQAAVSQAFEEAVLTWEPAIHRRVQTLWSLANIATLIGLIGTIVGLIGAFAAIGLASPDQKTLLLTKGIAEAMNNTAFGLTIAVTNIIGHMFIHSKARYLVDDIEFAVVQIENQISGHQERQASSGQAANS